LIKPVHKGKVKSAKSIYITIPNTGWRGSKFATFNVLESMIPNDQKNITTLTGSLGHLFELDTCFSVAFWKRMLLGSTLNNITWS
jgi:hypothetical protein